MKSRTLLNYSSLIGRVLPLCLAVAICLSLTSLVASVQAQAQVTTKIAHPRMLIGEHDPLTGFVTTGPGSGLTPIGWH